MESAYDITIRNKKIYDYYKKNTSINIETMNLILLDLMEKLSVDMSTLLQNTFQGQLMSEVKDVKQQLLGEVKDMRQQLTTLQESLVTKINKSNDEFIEKTKLIFSLSTSDNKDHMTQLLNRNADLFIERLNAIIPKTNEEMNKKIQDQLTLVHKSIQLDIQQYLNKTDTPFIEFISTFDSKLSSIQQPIFSLINSNQDNISIKIGSVKDDMLLTKSVTDKLYTEMNDYLNKYKASSHFKGAVSERDLERLLIDMFPEDEIVNTTGETASGDFILKRNNQDYIMFETKAYQTNVDTKEVEKFMRDAKKLSVHSIMMSQYTGIVGRKPYAIEINDQGRILIYLHQVNFSQDKIRQAVQIIDNMAPRMKQITEEEQENGINIDKSILDKINKEFISFLDNKEKLKNFLKEQNKMACTQVDALEMPDLSAFLDEKCPSSKKFPIYCQCGYGCHNRKQLSNHQRNAHPSTESSEIENEIVENDFKNMNLSQLKEECKKRNINISGKKKEELITLLG